MFIWRTLQHGNLAKLLADLAKKSESATPPTPALPKKPPVAGK